ncbi:MAG: tryptophan synthase subunit alpha [Ostreibacterium sp.]
MNTDSQRLAMTFAKLREKKQKALVPYITTGDPVGIPVVEIMHGLVKGGANIIELGIPFSDPAADGQTIQQAGERAIANGISYKDSLAAVKTFREKNTQTPVILMGYLNPAEIHPKGFVGFSSSVKKVGADAVILVDLSYESGAKYRQTLRHANIDLINLIAPTTTKTRLGKIVKNASGFIYYVSMRGITGNIGKSGSLNTLEIEKAITRIRAKTDLPICIGFGINTAEVANKVATFAEGVIVGSALVKKLYNAAQNNQDVVAQATAFMAEFRIALDE